MRNKCQCIPCRYYVLSGSQSQILTAPITLSSVSDFGPRILSFRPPNMWKYEDAISLSNQIFFLWLPESCVRPCIVTLKQDICWVLVRPISFEMLPDFCQRSDVGVRVDSLPSSYRVHKTQSFTVHKTVTMILPADKYFEFSLTWTLGMVPFHGLSFCLHFKIMDSGNICCNNS